MTPGSKQAVSRASPLPSIDALLRAAECAPMLAEYGRAATAEALRATLAALRAQREPGAPALPAAAIADAAAAHLAAEFAPSQKRVFNLTGTVLHTNLGRAPLPPEAARAAAEALAHATSLEFDLANGRRGEREAHVRGLLARLTGAEGATVVNNNAAAVLLVLNTLAARREVPVSRGELIEIGGSFRIPDIMARAGARLVEVGTTNRTHAADYRDAIGRRTALLMRVHQANYAIAGFTARVADAELAGIAHSAGLPFVHDLGSGSLVDLAPYGLPQETTPQEALAAGADLVTFSGDKLLGGPQAGLVVGRRDLIARLDRNHLKRALRLDKARLAALEAVLRLYLMPDRLAGRLPALRLLTRPEAGIRAAAGRLAPAVAQALAGRVAAVEIVACRSQIGSGALPVDLLPSWALALSVPAGRGEGRRLEALARWLRQRPVPVVGRIAERRLLLDLRCLESGEEATFLADLA